MSSIRASTTSGLVHWVIKVLHGSPSSGLVVPKGTCNQPAVRDWTAKTRWSGSWPIQQPDLLPLGRPNQNPYPSTCGFCQVWLDPSVLICNSVFRVSLFIVAFAFSTVNHKILTLVCYCHFWCIGHLNDRNKQRDTPYHMQKMSVNGVSTTVGCVSWLIWWSIGCRQPYTMYWPPS